MNKLFTKIASLTLGLALAAGAGAFLGSRAVKSASASEAVAASCDLTNQSIKTTGYSKEHTVGDYKVYGGQNNNGGWAYYKFGGKKASSSDPAMVTDAYVKGTTAVAEDVTKVEIILLTCSTNNVTVTWTVDYSNVADFSSKQTIDKGTLTYKVAGSYFAAPESGTFGSSKYFRVNFHIENNTTTNGVLFVTKVNFYYESAVSRGEASINGLDTSLLFAGGSKALSAGWDPLDSGATVSSYSFTSSNTDVLSFSGNTLNAVAPGKAKVTLNLTDSNSEEYEVVSDTIYVSNTYSFDVGDDVALYTSGVSKELSSIDKSGSTHYGVGTEYVTKPNGTYLLTVEEGNVSGSLSFVNDGNYLAWTSGNSLTTKTTKDDNASWFVVSYDDYDLLVNVATTSREIWWNNGNPRFACYEGKTPETSGYNTTSLMKIEEAPVRGTLTIANEFGSTMRQNATDTLSYNWTPAEGSSATISSYSWTSTNTDAISISGSVYTAIGPGKAKIQLSATDSTGQEYSVSTSDITVITVVSGSYVKYTSISDGDTVALVCEADGTELSDVKSNIGEYVFYETAPASIFDFTVVQSGDLFAFVDSDGKYLTWADASNKAEIKLVEEPTSKSYWSVAFDEGNAIITNQDFDGETQRYLAWNHGSPRFAAYKTGQTAIQLYGPSQDIVISENGLAFINNLLSYTCDASGEDAPSVSAWGDLNDQYDATGADLIPTVDKDLFKGITAVEHASPVTTREKVEQAMAKYDYIVGKYNKTLGLTEDYPDFINRDPAPLRNISAPTLGTNSSNTAIIVVTIIAVVSVSSIGVLLVLKRRKNHI